MSSDIELFRTSPYRGKVGAGLDAIPLKRNMQDPANQAAAKNAWAAYRKRLGVAATDLPRGADGYSDNLTRASRELGRKYWGMPEDRINELLAAEMGVSPAPKLNYWKIAQPLDGNAFYDASKHAITMPALPYDAEPERRFGTLIHDNRHAQVRASYPTFSPDYVNQRNAKKYDAFANQPNHFPGNFRDRDMAEVLEAEGLARDYGGYPDWLKQRKMPWIK